MEEIFNWIQPVLTKYLLLKPTKMDILGDNKKSSKYSFYSKVYYTLGEETIHICNYFEEKCGECYNDSYNSLYLYALSRLKTAIK